MRKCRNWQTSKTKDLVAAMSCGFKSHLPHCIKEKVHPSGMDLFLLQAEGRDTFCPQGRKMGGVGEAVGIKLSGGSGEKKIVSRESDNFQVVEITMQYKKA